jgi:hypothetical protein
MNLVMIGRFKDAGDAARAKQVIDWIAEQVKADVEAGLMEVGDRSDRFTDGMFDLLTKVSLHTVGPGELEQLGCDFTVKVESNQVVVTTEESDVSTLLKMLIDNGARVEIYSAHEYPNTGYGRGG